MLIKKLYKEITLWGIREVSPPTLFKQLLVANQIAFTAFVLCCFEWPYGFIHQNWPLAVSDTITSLGLGSVLVLNRYAFYKTSRITLMLIANFGILSTSLFLGVESGTHLIFISACAIPLILFRELRLWQYIVMSLLPMSLFVFLKTFGFSYFAFLKQDSPKWYYWSQVFAAFVLNFMGYYYFYFAHIDIENKLAQSLDELKFEQLKRINLSKMTAVGEMAAGIAHEINNPLTIISGRVLSLRRALGPKNETNQQLYESIESIQKMSQRMTRIIKGLLAFVRNVENDPYEKSSLNVVVQDALELCQARMMKGQIDFILDIPTDYTITCRPTQIAQVILNLLNNSYDAVENLSEKWIRLRATQKGNHVNITVTDSGPGISDEIAEKILQPFFTTKEVGKGTGLGLSISKGLIEAHRGRLYYNKNSPNTQFVIELPLATPV